MPVFAGLLLAGVEIGLVAEAHLGFESWASMHEGLGQPLAAEFAVTHGLQVCRSLRGSAADL